MAGARAKMILGRVAQALPVVAGVVVISFLLTRALPGDPAAYFATMYRAVTRRIAEDIAEGRFDDGPRMDALDTTFANFYFAAYEARRQGQAASAPWTMVPNWKMTRTHQECRAMCWCTANRETTNVSSTTG